MSDTLTQPKHDHWIVAVLFPLFLCLLGPWWDIYQFNHDEGMNLATAALIAEGYDLYGEIWSDQAPLVSYLLSAVHMLTGGSVPLARASILGFGAITALSLFCLVRSYHGRFAGWISVLLLMTSQIIAKNSVSAMIGIPALALALLSMAVLCTQTTRRQELRLCLAGILFGLSLQAKLFTILMSPVLVLLVYEFCRRARNDCNWGKVAASMLISASCAVATFIVVAWLNGMLSLDQIFGVHANARSTESLSGRGGMLAMVDQMWRSEIPVVIFGTLGAIACLLRFERRNLVVLFWILVAVVGLSIHRPLWKHHLVLLIVPLCWAAGAGIQQGIQYLLSGKFTTLQKPKLIYALVTAILLAGVVPNSLYLHQRFTQGNDIPETFHRLNWFQSGDAWLVTDAPLDAYRLATLVPPELALYSEKRVKTGNLGSDQLQEVVNKYRPMQVSLRRKITPIEFREWMMARFRTTQSYSLRSTLLHSGRYFHFVSPQGYEAILDRLDPPDGPAREEAAKSVHGLMATTFDIAYIVHRSGYGGVFYHRYGHRYDGFNQGYLLSRDQVVTRLPQSTQQLGQCFLDAFAVTGRIQLLGESMRSARALACVQNQNGSWEASAFMDANCLDGDGVLAKVSGVVGETVDEDSHDLALIFSRNLATVLGGSPHGPPQWLLEMIDAAERVSTTNTQPASGSPMDYVNAQSRSTDYHYQRDQLMENNPDGLQTTEDLVNQCYAMIRALRSG